MEPQEILVVEDDPRMQRMLESQLTARGFTVRVADNGLVALETLQRQPPDLILLDIGLPGPDGLEVCRRIRMESRVPILFITVHDQPATKVTALELGGDDYLTKPFHAEELIARIRAILRRAAPQPEQESLRLGDLTIDLANREVRRAGEEVRLTKTEFDLLRELITHHDTVIPYRQLLEAVWGPRYEEIGSVHVHMCNLRRKLEGGPTSPRHIMVVPGVGYRFRLNA